VITGASGFVGRQLIPLFIDQGYELLLVGRSYRVRESELVQIRHCTYDQIHEMAHDCGALVHLATVNNDSDLASSEFHRANVEFLLETAHLAKSLGIEKFISVTSTHALDHKARDNYSISKATGDRRLHESGIKGIFSIYSPAIYGQELAGKLKLLEILPASLRHLAIRSLSIWKPVISVERLADCISEIITSDNSSDQPTKIFISEPIEEQKLFAVIKRSGDLFFALCVVIFAGWLMVVIAAAVKLTSPGPAIFSQQRIGKNQKIFRCYKFRTMSVGTKESATHEVHSSSVTKIGAFLRAVKLDELPQVFNIFANTMSLIGPRPCLPMQKELISQRQIRNVYSVKPGITGLAQIQGIDMSNPLILAEIDAQYLAQRTMLNEIKILVCTFFGQGRGDRTDTKTV